MKKHPTSVEGFDGSLKELAQRVGALRYDKHAEFFHFYAEEILVQANRDVMRRRNKLAILLTAAWGIARALQKQFEIIFYFCAPYMKDELGGQGTKLGYEDRWGVKPDRLKSLD
jgi:hypothetical protein